MNSLPKKKSRTTKKETVTEPGFLCEFCNHGFKKESSWVNHLCIHKKRWLDRDLPSNRLGFQSWFRFNKKNTNLRKNLSYLDFSKSRYYAVFVKFGSYCIDVHCLNVNRFVDWLLFHRIRIDNWCSDTYYTNFIIRYLKDEDPMDATARSIETTIDMAKVAEVQSCDCLRYVNRNRLCQAITNGKISPWMLYNSESGIAFLEALDSVQQKYILDYIDPEQWNIKFKRNPEIVEQVKGLLSAAGY